MDAELGQLEGLFLEQMKHKPYADIEDFRIILKKLQVDVNEHLLISALEDYFGLAHGINKGEEMAKVMERFDDS